MLQHFQSDLPPDLANVVLRRQRFSCSFNDFLMQPTLHTQMLLLVPTVAVLGLPHGALDLPIAQTLWPLHGWRGNMRFGLLYIGLTALVIGFWILFPGPALFAFLIYSALHFSGDWAEATPSLRWTGGIATIGAPGLFGKQRYQTFLHFSRPRQLRISQRWLWLTLVGQR